jgi:pyruvate dehydrogenase E2 component (dihydrolipoamide acetyltransferase)
MPDVAMPRLSDSMEEGTILRWLRASGDEVARGDELVEIETDKANMTYEADASGVLEIVAEEGATLPIGELIARIGNGSPAASRPTEPAAHAVTAPAPPRAPVATPPASSPSRPAVGDGGEAGKRVKASPVARRIARELGVDLAGVAGSGPGGRVVKADVEARVTAPAAAPSPAPAGRPGPAAAPPSPAAPAVPAPVLSGAAGSGKGEARRVEPTKVQQTIARRMAEAKATVPDFQVTTEADMAAAVALRAQMKALATDGAPAPSFNDMVVKAAALALREFPRANGAYKDGAWELYGRVNVGVAVAAQDALIVPTVFDADQKSLGEIAREARALAARVRAGEITPPELSGGTFTVSNLGMFGVTEFTAIINGGQAGILSVGALRDVPVVEQGRVVPGKRMALTLACDHRILYGADAAEFLGRIRALLEAPLALAL